MQQFRTATTIDEERQIRLMDVPFQPGTAVEVIVRERAEREEAPPSGRPGQPRRGTAERQREWMRLAERQYRVADQYPEEYVILIGDRVVHHSSDR